MKKKHHSAGSEVRGTEGTTGEAGRPVKAPVVDQVMVLWAGGSLPGAWFVDGQWAPS